MRVPSAAFNPSPSRNLLLRTFSVPPLTVSVPGPPLRPIRSSAISSVPLGTMAGKGGAGVFVISTLVADVGGVRLGSAVGAEVVFQLFAFVQSLSTVPFHCIVSAKVRDAPIAIIVNATKTQICSLPILLRISVLPYLSDALMLVQRCRQHLAPNRIRNS